VLPTVFTLSIFAFFLFGGFRPVETYIGIGQGKVEVFVALIYEIFTPVFL
jgi:hypothetical protein